MKNLEDFAKCNTYDDYCNVCGSSFGCGNCWANTLNRGYDCAGNHFKIIAEAKRICRKGKLEKLLA